MNDEQRSRFNNLLSRVINSAITGERYEHQLAHEDHLRNYAIGLLEEQEAEIVALKAQQITPEEADFTDEYGTKTWSGRDFDGWIARLGHGTFRKGEVRITFMDAQEIQEALEILMGMWLVSKERDNE